MDLLISANTVAQTQADQPPASGTPGWATDGNAAEGILATDFPAWHYNMMMNELLAFVKAAGLTPSNADWSQVLKAMQTIFAPAQRGVAPYSAALAQLIGGYPKYAIVIDAGGTFWRSTVDGNMAAPAAGIDTWQLFFSGYATNTDVPIGIPQPWPIATPPTGWLVCNGAAFSAEQYPSLGAVYGGTLPDLRGVFIRGLDGGRGLDSGRTLLSYQDDAIQSMSGKISFTATSGADSTVTYADGVFTATGEYMIGSHNQFAAAASGSWSQDVIMQASNVARTATETRPKNIAFNYIVRAA